MTVKKYPFAYFLGVDNKIATFHFVVANRNSDGLENEDRYGGAIYLTIGIMYLTIGIMYLISICCQLAADVDSHLPNNASVQTMKTAISSL